MKYKINTKLYGILCLFSLSLIIISLLFNWEIRWVFILSFVFSLSLVCYFCKNKEHVSSLKYFFSTTLFLSIFSLFVTMYKTSTEDPITVIRRVFHKDNKIDLSKDINNEKSKADTTKEELLILLDVSKTIAEKKLINNEEKKYYQDYFRIYDTLVMRQYDKSISEKFQTLVKDKCMLSLFKLKLFDIVYKNSSKYKIKIICFSNNIYCSDERSDKDYKENGITNLEDAIDFIDDDKNKALLNTDTTNFLILLQHLNRYSKNSGLKMYTEKPKKNMAFLTDYLHDETNEKDSSLIQKEIKNLFLNNIYSNIFFFRDVRPANENEVNVYPLLKNAAAAHDYNINELFIDSDIKDYHLLSKNTIYIYYDKNNYQGLLQTKITFEKVKEEQKRIFSLKCAYDYFYLLNNKNEDIDGKEIDVSKHEELSLIYSGEVDSEDLENERGYYLNTENANSSTNINIKFIKDLPEWSKIIITFLFISIFVSLFITRCNKTSGSGSDTPNDPSGGGSGSGSDVSNMSGKDNSTNNNVDVENDKEIPKFPIGYKKSEEEKNPENKNKINNEQKRTLTIKKRNYKQVTKSYGNKFQ